MTVTQPAPVAADELLNRTRWGQLTYSSFDRHDGRGGGWQVKDTTGDLAGDEIEFLRARVQTQFDPGVELPRFPTPAEIEEFPRRLIHGPARVRLGETALWHHVPAGNDASGRPGNVFAHVVFDRNPDASDPLRPIERWRSDGWLVPFGPEQVLAADLTSADPPPPGPLNRRTISSWLFAPRQWRMQTLAVLLDAARAAMAGGPLIVLGVDDVDEAANWIAAVSFAMSAGTARRFHFSTLERPDTLAEAADRELHLACVPRPDLAALARREGIVAIDTEGVPELGDLDGEPHRTARGDRIEVTEWSVLVSELFADPRAMAAAVAEFDRVAHSIGDSGLDPAWPAAMLISGRSRAESRKEAARVMASCAPPQLRSVPELYDSAVAGLRREVRGRVDRAWRQVRKVGADQPDQAASVSGEVAVRVYVELALAEEPWLAEHGPARLPSKHYYSPAPEPDLVRLAGLLCQHISSFSEDLPANVMLDEARAGLHFVELALRLGLAHDEELARALWQVCQQSLVPVLVHPELGGRLADQVERQVADETRHWLWSQLAERGLDGLGVPGQRLAPSVLAALGPGPDDPDPLAATWGWLSGAEPQAPVGDLIGEYAWHRVRGGDTGADARYFAVRSAVEAYARDGHPAVLAAAAPLLQPGWETARLSHLLRACGPAVPADWLLRAIAESAADDLHAQTLLDDLAARSEPSLAREFAGVRGALDLPDWLTVVRPDYLVHWLGVLADGLTAVKPEGAQPDAELLRRVNGVVILGLLAARGRSPEIDPAAVERAAGQAQAAVAGFPGAEARLTDAEATELIAWCDEHGVDSTALAELFLLADPRSALRSATDRVAGWLHAVPTGQPDSPPVTALVLAARVSRSAESRDRVAEEIMRAVRTAPGSADDRAARQAERFLAAWLRQAQTGRVRR